MDIHELSSCYPLIWVQVNRNKTFWNWFDRNQDLIAETLTKIMATRWTSTDLERGDLIQLTGKFMGKDENVFGGTAEAAEIRQYYNKYIHLRSIIPAELKLENPTKGLYVYNGREVVTLEHYSEPDLAPELAWLPAEFTYPEFPADYWHGHNGMNPKFNLSRIDLSLYQRELKLNGITAVAFDNNNHGVVYTTFTTTRFDPDGNKIIQDNIIVDDNYYRRTEGSVGELRGNFKRLLNSLMTTDNQAEQLFTANYHKPLDPIRARIYAALPSYMKDSHCKIFWNEAVADAAADTPVC